MKEFHPADCVYSQLFYLSEAIVGGFFGLLVFACWFACDFVTLLSAPGSARFEMC